MSFKPSKNRPSQNPFPKGILYNPQFISPGAHHEIRKWLSSIHPIWEMRYAENHPPPPGKEQRQLLRPVYWLGNWQFACLNYYHPPRNVENCCVKAEPFPSVLADLVAKIEKITRRAFTTQADLPNGWHLNTCLVNLYGSRFDNDEEKWVDTARVGEHKDFEPGPVASLSLGERAMFQFVESRRGGPSRVVFDQWLDDGSLQVFGGPRWKDKLFHRVQRVDKRAGHKFSIPVDRFSVRRVNFTFRYVPDRYIVPFSKLDKGSKADVLPYMTELAKHSKFFRSELGTGGV